MASSDWCALRHDHTRHILSAPKIALYFVRICISRSVGPRRLRSGDTTVSLVSIQTRLRAAAKTAPRFGGGRLESGGETASRRETHGRVGSEADATQLLQGTGLRLLCV